MPNAPDFDIRAAHRYLAADCFNKAWELMDKPDRTPEEGEQMIRLSLASHYHWTQREDYSPTSKSVACWQASRFYAILGQGENARRYAALSLTACQEGGVAAFYRGYAYEALARAEAVCGDQEQMQAHLAAAAQAAESVTEPEDRKTLLDDLASIRMS